MSAVIDSLADLARSSAERSEADRRLPSELVEQIRGAGLFSALVPASLGGGEIEPAELVESITTLAAGDGAAGWCVAVAATSGMLAAYLEPDQAEFIFGSGDPIVGGVFAPRGKAVVGQEGYRVSGRWSFASGCEHSDWLMGGCVVTNGGEPVKLESGAPDIRLMLMPAGQVEIIDTWDVAGLRGTGSHDFEVEDLIVPHGRSASLISDKPLVDGPLYGFPVFGLLAVAIASVGMGIARASLDELIGIAGRRRPTGSSRSLAERGSTQAAVSRAEATLGAARALIDRSVDEAWRAAQTGEAMDVTTRSALRRAATHAIGASRDVVDSMYELGGGGAIYASSPLQRQMRDIHVATQHMLVAPATWELTGRAPLGLETDASQL